MPNRWSRHGACVGWPPLDRRTAVALRQKVRQERVMVEAPITESRERFPGKVGHTAIQIIQEMEWDPGSSLTCQYCPHHTCVLGPGLQSLTGGLPGDSGSDSHRETRGEAPSPLRQRAQCLPIRGALPYFQNCCSEAVDIRILFMTKPIQSQLLFCFKNL